MQASKLLATRSRRLKAAPRRAGKTQRQLSRYFAGGKSDGSLEPRFDLRFDRFFLRIRDVEPASGYPGSLEARDITKRHPTRSLPDGDECVGRLRHEPSATHGRDDVGLNGKEENGEPGDGRGNWKASSPFKLSLGAWARLDDARSEPGQELRRGGVRVLVQRGFLVCRRRCLGSQRDGHIPHTIQAAI